MVELRKFKMWVRVDFYGENQGTVVSCPYVMPNEPDTMAEVMWDSGEIYPEYLWALKPIESRESGINPEIVPL